MQFIRIVFPSVHFFYSDFVILLFVHRKFYIMKTTSQIFLKYFQHIFRRTQFKLIRLNVILTMFWIKKRYRCFRSSGGVMVKIFACGAGGPWFDSWFGHYDFRDLLFPAFKSRYGWNTALKWRKSSKQPTNQAMMSLRQFPKLNCSNPCLHGSPPSTYR